MKDNRLAVTLFDYELDNPICPASGTYGFGYEFSRFYDINILGTFSTKGTTLEPRFGNPLPRIAECPSGLINSVGLQNPGVDKVLDVEFKKLKEVFNKKVIANVCGSTVEDYVECAKKLDQSDMVFALEVNISCPNVKCGGIGFGTDEKLAYELTKAVKENVKKPVIVKLSPNVTNIVNIALAVEKAGADAVSLINTLLGMRFNLRTGKPIIHNKMGGYSGPGVFPVALRMVYQVSQAVSIPVIGMGGVRNAYDVVEMMYAGATVVQVGSENLVDPYACQKIIEDLPRVLDELNIKNIKDIIGRGFKNE